MENRSLKTRIKLAQSAEELQSLLTEGRTYEFAAIKTKRQWMREIAKRQASIK